MNYSIEVNDSRFALASYDASTQEFLVENVSPIAPGLNSLKIRLADSRGNILASATRDFIVETAPQNIIGMFSLEDIAWILVQIVLLLVFLVLLLNFLLPLIRGVGRGAVYFPQHSILLVEGRVGSGKEEFCLGIIRNTLGRDNFAAVLSRDPVKEEGWLKSSEKNRVIFVKIEPDINEISWSISKALSAKPKGMFFNILDLLIPKYNEAELTDFLNTNFKKLRDAGCGAVFCVDKMADEKKVSAIEGLFDGVVEFQVQEEKGTLGSYYRVREFRLEKIDTNWRRFK